MTCFGLAKWTDSCESALKLDVFIMNHSFIQHQLSIHSIFVISLRFCITEAVLLGFVFRPAYPLVVLYR